MRRDRGHQHRVGSSTRPGRYRRIDRQKKKPAIFKRGVPAIQRVNATSPRASDPPITAQTKAPADRIGARFFRRNTVAIQSSGAVRLGVDSPAIPVAAWVAGWGDDPRRRHAGYSKVGIRFDNAALAIAGGRSASARMPATGVIACLAKTQIDARWNDSRCPGGPVSILDAATHGLHRRHSRGTLELVFSNGGLVGCVRHECRQRTPQWDAGSACTVASITSS